MVLKYKNNPFLCFNNYEYCEIVFSISSISFDAFEKKWEKHLLIYPICIQYIELCFLFEWIYQECELLPMIA